MVDAETVRALALSLPCAADDSEPGRLAFSMGGKGFAWTYLERIAPKKPRVSRLEILAVRRAIERKEMQIGRAHV